MNVGTGFLSSGPTSARLVTGRDFSPAVSSQHGTAPAHGRGLIAVPLLDQRGWGGRALARLASPHLYDHTPRSLSALERVVRSVAQESEQLPALRRLRSAC